MGTFWTLSATMRLSAAAEGTAPADTTCCAIRSSTAPPLPTSTQSSRSPACYPRGRFSAQPQSTAAPSARISQTAARQMSTSPGPRWRSGPPAALDFAVTSGLRLDALADAVHDRDKILTKYEDFKCSYKDTKTLCNSQGISFIPMVMEAVGGGWGKEARRLWSELAKKRLWPLASSLPTATAPSCSGSSSP